MQDLIVHIGTHKTGSTAIQRFIAANGKALRKSGLQVLPTPTCARQVRLANTVSDDLVKCLESDLRRGGLFKSRKPGNRFVWSSEQFSGDPYSGYKNAGVLAESLRRATSGVSVKIIVWLRRQDDFLQSLYTQSIHEGSGQHFYDFVQGFTQHSLNWESLIEAYSACFGEQNLVVRLYQRTHLPEHDSLLRDFLHIGGLNAKRIDELLQNHGVSIVNRGYDSDALEIARLTNPYLDRQQQKSLRKILQETAAKDCFAGFSYWTPEERSRFLRDYAESNVSIAKRFFDPEAEALFSQNDLDDIAELPTETNKPTLDLESAVPVIMKAIIYISRNQEKPKTNLLRIFTTKLKRMFTI